MTQHATASDGTHSPSARPARTRKATRRTFGSPRKLRSGRWQVSYTGPDGARHAAHMTFDGKLAAEAWLSAEHHLIATGQWTPPRERAKASTTGLTLDEYAPGAIARRRVRGRALKPRTRALYESQYQRLLSPELGQTPLRGITPDMVLLWYDRLPDAKATQKAHAYSLLRTLLGQAVEDGLIAENPCHIRGAGKVEHAQHEVRVATDAEVGAIVQNMPLPLAVLPLIGAWCGLRAGELMELRRKDVDLVAGTLRVGRGVVRVNGEYLVQTPKSTAGIRVVAIPPHILPAIEAHLREYVEPDREALLFCRPGNRHLIHTEVTKAFRRACEAAGRPDLHLHDLRHTAATKAAQAGATIAELMNILGHSTPMAAMRYQQVASGVAR